jgi:hypothetical protein
MVQQKPTRFVEEARMIRSRVPSLVGRSLIALLLGTGVIGAAVLTTLTMTHRSCDALCTSLLRQRSAFEEEAVRELQRCERITHAPCAPADAGVAYDGATTANERLVAYRLAHGDESAAIAARARRGSK